MMSRARYQVCTKQPHPETNYQHTTRFRQAPFRAGGFPLFLSRAAIAASTSASAGAAISITGTEISAGKLTDLRSRSRSRVLLSSRVRPSLLIELGFSSRYSHPFDMAAPDGSEEGRSFRINFTDDGVGMLRERVKEKLREFMGDYTDDTLVEYVVVLLRNGRRKDEARNELNVFLGDDCVSFVSWLWDHLSSNLHLYAQAKEPLSDQVAKTKPTSGGLAMRENIQFEHLNGGMQIDSERDRQRSTNVSRHRHSRESDGLVQEAHPFSLRSIISEDFYLEDKNYQKNDIVRQSCSPSPQIHRKRSRLDEPPLPKRTAISHHVIDAPRRLLQFAVRDAVRTVQQTNSRTVPALKRLRSVVSTPIEDSESEERPLSRSLPRDLEFITGTQKAAVEDVRQHRNSGSVFDRLRCGTDQAETVNQSSGFGAYVREGEYEYFDQVPESSCSKFYQNGNYVQEFTGDASRMTMLDRDNEMICNSASDNDNDRYDDVSISNHRSLNVSRSAYSNKERDKMMTQYSISPDETDKLMTQYSVSPNADQIARKTGLIDQNPSASTPGNAPHKIVNISVNVNTWKPSHYEKSKSVKEDNHVSQKKNGVGAVKPSLQLLKDVARTDFQKEIPKTVVSTLGSSVAARPDDDVDSRILFVSNVHFAATKDSISRHFNKFGEVRKVIIVTDATTGQPKGSAYVEFTLKESAENALSLNGTSFMSRILKVVRRSSAQHESTPVIRRPPIARASPYSSMVRGHIPRGALTGVFRGHLPTKHGARSLQWKRDAPNTQTSDGLKNPQNAPVTAGKNIPTLRGRSLTYIRPGLKAEGIVKTEISH